MTSYHVVSRGKCAVSSKIHKRKILCKKSPSQPGARCQVVDVRWHILPVSVQCGRGIGPYEQTDGPPEAETPKEPRPHQPPPPPPPVEKPRYEKPGAARPRASPRERGAVAACAVLLRDPTSSNAGVHTDALRFPSCALLLLPQTPGKLGKEWETWEWGCCWRMRWPNKQRQRHGGDHGDRDGVAGGGPGGQQRVEGGQTSDGGELHGRGARWAWWTWWWRLVWLNRKRKLWILRPRGWKKGKRAAHWVIGHHCPLTEVMDGFSSKKSCSAAPTVFWDFKGPVCWCCPKNEGASVRTLICLRHQWWTL